MFEQVKASELPLALWTSESLSHEGGINGDGNSDSDDGEDSPDGEDGILDFDSDGSSGDDDDDDEDAARAALDQDVEVSVLSTKVPLNPDQEARALAAERRKKKELNSDKRKQQHQLGNVSDAMVNVSKLLSNHLNPAKKTSSFIEMNAELTAFKQIARDYPHQFTPRQLQEQEAAIFAKHMPPPVPVVEAPGPRKKRKGNAAI